ncbi:MAG: type II toxin-antitoxin system HicA family toxin [Muribaculaceae bacterium]|nr:type II toxin-antitoxin system HicA family toxin [Muribaculaceae bacterium]
MKYKQFHNFIIKSGWVAVRQRGSHVLYAKEGYPRLVPVPLHTGEIPEPLRRAIMKEMGLK